MPEITKNQLKHIRLLRQKKYRQQYGEFIVEGEKNVGELLVSNYSITTIFATEDWEHSFSEIEITIITNKQLSQISNLSAPNKVLAIAKIPEVSAFTFPKTGLTLCLDSINDPGNLGTIIRTADWFGVENIICSPDSVDSYNPKVVQTTKGSIFNVAIHYQDLKKLLSNTKTPIYGADMKGEKVTKDFYFSNPSILLMGSESHGISDEIEKLLTQKITIQRKGKAESLNVAIATSILLHHFNT
jgi:RNA methyltransferase, TrmH family